MHTFSGEWLMRLGCIVFALSTLTACSGDGDRDAGSGDWRTECAPYVDTTEGDGFCGAPCESRAFGYNGARYCTATCMQDADCPAGHSCEKDWGQEHRLCLIRCSPLEPCEAGTMCSVVSASMDRFCVPAPP